MEVLEAPEALEIYPRAQHLSLGSLTSTGAAPNLCTGQDPQLGGEFLPSWAPLMSLSLHTLSPQWCPWRLQ